MGGSSAAATRTAGPRNHSVSESADSASSVIVRISAIVTETVSRSRQAARLGATGTDLTRRPPNCGSGGLAMPRLAAKSLIVNDRLS